MAQATSLLPNDAQFEAGLKRRHQRGARWQVFFLASTLFSLVILVVLLLTIVDRAFGLVAVQYRVDPDTLAEQPLEALDAPALAAILGENVRQGLLIAVVLNNLMPNAEPESLNVVPIRNQFDGEYSEEIGATPLTQLTADQLVEIIGNNISADVLRDQVYERVANRQVLAAWGLFESTFNRSGIEARVSDRFPEAEIEFRSWLNRSFLTGSTATEPEEAGIRSGIIGTLWVIAITMGLAIPIGIGAAIYLEEYAGKSWLNSFIETNIRNLAGVPSIIYGLLGLAIFVRALGSITQGNTILSAALTMALLILPVVIINAQEAIRAVPYSYREASYGLGATRWQTVSRQVLPSAIPGILTGTILSLSRAIGETAPLIVIGAAISLTQDPTDPFSQFTVMPIQVYNWIQEAKPEFRFTASAGIIILMIVLLSLNSVAIILRNRFSRRLA